MSSQDARPQAATGIVRRLVRPFTRPVAESLDIRFAALHDRIAALEAATRELHDHVEADVATLIELTLELRRLAESLESATRDRQEKP